MPASPAIGPMKTDRQGPDAARLPSSPSFIRFRRRPEITPYAATAPAFPYGAPGRLSRSQGGPALASGLDQARSNRSRSMTLDQAATKSWTNLSRASSLA